MSPSQSDRSRATRAALLAAGRRLFAEHGYAGVSADEIVAAAGLTRGALHHHYKDKRGLFQAVYTELERELTNEVTELIKAAPDVPTRMLVGLAAFLDVCQRPEVLRISMLDAPTVLGWDTWRAIEAEHALGVIVGMLREGMAEGLIVEQSPEVLGRFLLSALIEAALFVAHADDPAEARATVEQALGTLFSGITRGSGV
jgi:AcrR family transcriptional regulator